MLQGDWLCTTMMIEGDDGELLLFVCWWEIPRYSSFFGCHLLPDKIEKFPTALLFCVGDAYGLVMMILWVLLWNHTWLALLNVSIYLSTLLNNGSGGGRCVLTSLQWSQKSTKKLTNIGGWSIIPKYCGPFSNEGIQKRKNMNLIWNGLETAAVTSSFMANFLQQS